MTGQALLIRLLLAASSVLLELGYVAIIWAAFHGFGMAGRYGLGLGAALVIMVLSSVGVLIPTPGSAGSYHAFNTCNSWTNRVLASIGVRTAMWSPTDHAILYQLR